MNTLITVSARAGCLLAALLGLVGMPATSRAGVVDVIANGSFETGSFSSWNATGLNEGGCGTTWHLSNTGATGCNSVDTPAFGTFEANNAFDGTGPKTYSLSQTFNVPGASVISALLSWSDTSNVTVGCCGAGTQSREFYVDLTAGITSKVYSQLFVDNCGPTHPDCTSEVHHWTGHAVDLTSFLNAHIGESVTVSFNNFVPQVFSGAGGFGLDGVSLVVNYTDAPEPAPAWMCLAGAALLSAAGRWRSKRARL